MPFYEYECQACGRHHEAMQKMSEAPLRTCPYCLKPKLKRLISAPVFRLKGSGWYETDFKSDKEAKRNLHAEEPKAGAAEKGAAADTAGAKPDKAEAADKKADAAPVKAEAKPEAKAESAAATKSAAKSARRPAPKAGRAARRTPRRR